MRASTPPAHAPAETVLLRVAAAIEDAARKLSALEATLIVRDSGCEDRDLQTFDSVGQHLRALALFLTVASEAAEGEIGLTEGLDSVWLEQLRAKLAGEAPPATTPEVELW